MTTTHSQLLRLDAGDELEARRGRLFLRLLLLLIVANLVYSAVAVNISDQQAPTLFFLCVAHTTYTLAFVLAKRRGLRAAGAFVAASVTAIALVAPFFAGGGRAHLVALIGPLIITGFAAPPHYTVGICAAQLLGLVAIAGVLPQDNPSEVMPAPFLPLLAIVLVGLTAAGVLNHLLGQAYAHDIRRARLEEGRLRSAAEASTAAKGRFLASMSHELRTPLNAIIGYSQMLLEDFADGEPLDAEATEDLDRVSGAGRHLLSMVSDVLDMARIEAGDAEPHPEAFDAGRVTVEVAASFGAVVRGQGSQITVDAPEADVPVETDLTMVRQILFNLVSNAVKFTEGGRIDVTVRAEGDRVVWTVQDTGIGMTEQQLTRVFDEFVQADDSTTRRYGGTGLGLALVRRQSALLGGEVRASSAPGSGSRFVVDLPRVLCDRTVRATPTSSESLSSAIASKAGDAGPVDHQARRAITLNVMIGFTFVMSLLAAAAIAHFWGAAVICVGLIAAAAGIGIVGAEASRRGHVDLAGAVVAFTLSTLCLLSVPLLGGTYIQLLLLFLPLAFTGVAARPRTTVLVGAYQLSGLVVVALALGPEDDRFATPDFFLPLVALGVLLLVASEVVHRRLGDAFIRDLVERSEDEARLRRAAEAASEAKSQFLASMSHEVRTPLNAVVGYAEMVRESASEGRPFDPQALDDIRRIDAAGRHLLALITEILDQARREATDDAPGQRTQRMGPADPPRASTA